MCVFPLVFAQLPAEIIIVGATGSDRVNNGVMEKTAKHYVVDW